MKKKFFAFVCSAIISVNCLTFNTETVTALEPEIWQYIHDLEGQINNLHGELETYHALDHDSDGKITALDAQMLLEYYAESLVENNSNDVSGYKDFINNTET
jgi:hypothetical protein